MANCSALYLLSRFHICWHEVKLHVEALVMTEEECFFG